METRRFKVIRGGIVVDPAASRSGAADVLIDGDTVAEVGPPGLAAPQGALAIEASGKLLTPGLVNGHTHGHGTLAKGLIEDRWTLEMFLNNGPWLSGNRATGDKYLAAQLAAVEMVRKGCTACYDLYFEFPVPTVEGLEAVGRAYADVGIRAVVAPMIADFNLYQALPGLVESLPANLRPLTEKFALAPRQVTIEQARQVFRAWPFDRQQVCPAIAPTIPLHCSDGFMTDCRDLAAEFELPIQTHLAESRTQAVLGLEKYGKSLTAHLRSLGLLNARFSAAHGIWLDEADLALLAEAGSSVVHNPLSNMRVGSGLARVRPMVEHGVNVGIGTDASATSDSMNMFEAARLASFISRVQTADERQWLTADEVFAMATLGSARALGFGDFVGSLAPGFKADIVMLDAGHINYVPLNDALRQIVFSENGAAVDTVMIGGRVIVEHGRLMTVDEAKLRENVQATVARLLGANRGLREVSSQLTAAVGAFCRGMSARPHHVHRLADRADDLPPASCSA